MNTKWIGGILVLILIVIGGWYYFSNKDESPENTIKIGLAVGLTGYATNWGEGEVKAVELALEEYKNRLPYEVILVIEDTESDGNGTVNAMKKLVEIDRVRAIIGPTWGDSFQGGYPITEDAQIPVISTSAAFEALGDTNPYHYAFSTWWPQEQEALVLVEHMAARGITKVTALHDQDAFNSKIVDIFIDVANQRGGFEITRESVPVGTNDFRTEVVKVRARGDHAVLALFQDTGSVGPLMKQLREQNTNTKVYTTTSAQNEENLEKFPGLFDGLFYSFPSYTNDLLYLDIHERFIEKYGTDAAEGPAFVNAYNAAVMLFEVLANGARSGEEIRDDLREIHVAGIGTDDLYFNDNGQIGDIAFIIKTVENNQFIEVK